MKAHTKTGQIIGNRRKFQPNWMLFLFLAVLFTTIKTQAQTAKNFATKQPFLFEENKGQLRNESGNVLSDIKYYGKDGGVYVYCKTGMLSFVFTKTENEPSQISEATGLPSGNYSPFSKGAGGFNPKHQIPQPSKISTSRMDLVLIGSNPNSKITPTDQQEYYENFYTTGDADRGITNVHTYKTLTYNNIYPYIDMILNIAKKGMEYSFLVHPGGNVSDIKLQWNGAEKEKALKNGGNKYANALGSMEESAPKSFVEGKLVLSKFIKKDGLFGFKVVSYDKNKDLMIDPTINWGTYFGGDNGEVNGVASDLLNNVYITGFTESSSGFATSGAYQTTYGGSGFSGDAFLAKLDNGGKLIWSTYFGGGGEDRSLSIVSDKIGNIYFTGYTYSSSGIATSGAYQTSLEGYVDAFVAKFNSSGLRIWSSYFGGSGGDNIAFGIALDTSKNVYITGRTASSSNIATASSFQTSLVGTTDAFLAKFDSSGTMHWATYYGDSTIAQGIATDLSGNVYITGFTSASNLIATNGAYQTLYGGGSNDGFLAKFSSNGKRIWGTYFGGSSIERANGYPSIAADNNGSVYIFGTTGSTSGIATTGAYQTSLSGFRNDFLAKFNTNGSLNWSTYFGGNQYEDITGMVLDSFNNIYISGPTSSTTGIATSNTIRGSSGSYENFLAKFDNHGNRLFASYTIAGYSCGMGISSNNNVFICGYTNGNSNPYIATSGAYQTSFGTSSEGFLIGYNFDQPNAGVTAITSPTNPACPGYSPVKVILKDDGNTNITSATIAWAWDGAAQVPVTWTGTLKPNDSTTVLLGTVTLISNGGFLNGKYPVKAWPTQVNGNTNAGGTGDTAYEAITVDSLPSPYAGSNASICPGSTTTIGSAATSGSTYSWTSKPSGFTSTSSNPSVSPTATTIYYMTETNAGGCSAKDSTIITVSPAPNAGGKITTCLGAITGLIQIGEPPVTGTNYSWTSKPAGFTSTISNPGVSPTVTTIYYLTETDIATGCSATDSAVYTILPLPAANAGANSTVCAGSMVNIGAPKVTGSTYSWISTPPGFTSTLSNTIVSPSKTTSYTVTETNLNGCINSNSVTITVTSKPNAGFSYSQSCPGDSTNFTNADTTAKIYQWQFGDGQTSNAKNPSHLYSGLGSYHVTLLDSDGTGCTDSVSKSVAISSCVWPGDANFDKVDNIYDVLAIGIAYNDTGSKRTDTTTQWYAHPCNDWSKSFASGTNHKHADCNGDGKVDLQDLGVILINYSKTHSKTGGSVTSGNPSDPALSLSMSKDSVGTADTLSIQINLGTSAKPVSNIYGLCFSISYDPMNVNQSKGIMADFSKCWLGALNTNLIYLLHNDSTNGVLDIGLTRTDHNNISGYGSLGTLSIIMPDNVGGKREVTNKLHFNIENIKAIDFAESDISLYTVGDSVLFYGYANVNESAIGNLNHVRIFPNPANSVLHLDAGKDFISGITITNTLGQTVLAQKLTRMPQTDLDVSHLSAGTYFMDIQTDNGIARSRFVKN